jgi:predicted NAD-dependent protein-ADP-ribosyltransferase YbiA (DUF1768 family)
MQKCSYFIQKRALFGGYPTQSDVDELFSNGVRHFINLTYPTEPKIKPYKVPPSSSYLTFPIKDHNVPRDWAKYAHFIYKLADVIVSLPSPHKLYLHCRGGHGRAGMVVSTLLCYIFEYSPLVSLKKTSEYHSLRPNIKEKWKAIGSPHTYRQRAFVYRFFEPLKFHRLMYKNERDGCFSRFSHHPMVFEGDLYNCIEGALLTSAFPANKELLKTLYGYDLYNYRKKIDKKSYPEKWKNERLDLLEKLYKKKMDVYPSILDKLLRTGMRPVFLYAAGNFKWPDGTGQNVAGVALMNIKKEYIKNMKEV